MFKISKKCSRNCFVSIIYIWACCWTGIKTLSPWCWTPWLVAAPTRLWWTWCWWTSGASGTICSFDWSWSLQWCVRKWVLKLDDEMNFHLQIEQEYGFTPVWVRMCDCKFPLVVKALEHAWHLYGFSPVWIRMWRRRSLDETNPEGEKQRKGLYLSNGIGLQKLS